MSARTLKTKVEEIARKPPVAKDILSILQSFRKSGIAGLRKQIQTFPRKVRTQHRASKLKTLKNHTVSRSRASRSHGR